MRVPARLLKTTFMVEHNPNCPSPFLVRLVRSGYVKRDKSDKCGYGKTLAEASRNAFRDSEVKS